MENAFDPHDPASFDAEFERDIMQAGDSASREILASGMPIHIPRDDAPARHVVCAHPDGREELLRVDRKEARRLSG